MTKIFNEPEKSPSSFAVKAVNVLATCPAVCIVVAINNKTGVKEEILCGYTETANGEVRTVPIALIPTEELTDTHTPPDFDLITEDGQAVTATPVVTVVTEPENG